ncbi:MAG: T9SS type A sorting domain-containing protein [Paludibacter sp.]|nr:T9SS type A sorting domain-containing protein [Paludibacter sp.]
MKTLFSKINCIAILLVVFSVVPTFATNYYVDGVNGNNTNTGYYSILAKQTIQSAANLTNPGDTVFIMNGIYQVTSVNGNVLNMTRSGAAGQYITFKPMAGHSPKLKASGGAWEAIILDGSYVILDGLELEGNNANLTYTNAYQSWQNYENNIKDWSVISGFNTNGISFGKNATVHHLIVRNCKVHDFPGAGMGGGKVDYVTVENNIVYNNSWYTMYATSGISFLNTKNYDTETGYKIIIRNNIVYNNKTTVPWERTNALSDGNGIILDVNVGYTGRTLVENNVSYNNGGGGIHAFRANHIDIINNTAYNNGTVVGYPEIDGQQSTDVKIYNNIMYARTGGNCNGNDAGAIYDYNLYFNGSAFKKGAHDITADPKFINKALDGTANFQLQNTSPAINNGSSVAGQFTANDILGIARPVGFSSDMGAYEYPTVNPNGVTQIDATNDDVHVFPNPAKDKITVSFSARSGANVAIGLFDLQGRLHSAKNYTATNEGTNSVEFSVNSLRSGMYLLKVTGNSGLSKTTKIFIRN